MKKTLYALALGVTIISCNSSKKQEKIIQKQVLDLHEKVMADYEKALINKMKLDTLVTQAKLVKADTDTLNSMRVKLNTASEAMDNWMANFTPDYTGKGHDDVMRYFTEEQTKVQLVDSLLLSATKQSATYLQNIKKK